MSKSKHNHHFNSLTFISLFLISSSILPFAFASSSSADLNRPDPLQHFHYYHGGFDLQNKHYWASVIFTGVHGYAMAGVCMLCTLGCVILLIYKNIWNNNNNHFSSSSSVNHTDYSEFLYYMVLFLILLFSLLAMVATGFVIAKNHKTFQATKKLKETMLGAGNEARRTIHKINKVMNNIQSLLCPYDQSTCFLLNTTSHQLGTQSNNINIFIQKNDHSINQAIRALYITNLVVVTINLFFLIVGPVLILLHWHPGFIIIIFLCWILATACWLLTGIDFFFHKDTCTALQDYKDNPMNSSLSSLLPCSNALKSQTAVILIGQTVHDFITQLNLNINIIPKELGLDEAYYGNVLGDRKICDPFAGPPDYKYLARKCPKHAIAIRDLPDILARFTCEGDKSMESCTDKGKFLPKPTYLMAYAYIRSIEYLTNVYPDLDDLIHCSFVKNRISDVVLHQCKPFKKSTYDLWKSILCLSTSMVMLVLLWMTKAYQDHGRYFFKCSITPRNEEP